MNVEVYLVETSNLVDGVYFFIEVSSGERDGEKAMDRGVLCR